MMECLFKSKRAEVTTSQIGKIVIAAIIILLIAFIVVTYLLGGVKNVFAFLGNLLPSW
jgi:hypothetical protein